jgi:hypothetical protein
MERISWQLYFCHREETDARRIDRERSEIRKREPNELEAFT